MFFLIDRFNFLEKHTIKWKEKKNNYKKKKKQTNKQTNKQKAKKKWKNSTMLEQFQNPENLKVSKY